MQKLKNFYIKIFIFIFPIIFFLIFVGIKIWSPDIYILMIQEDTVVEYAQAFFYFLASIFSSLISIRFLKNKLTLHGILYSILAIGLLFIFLEEISWGQRMFNIETPDFFKQQNVQNEISIHNLDKVQSSIHKIYILIGFYGAFAWLFVQQFMSSIKNKCNHLVNFIVPDWFISSYFFFVLFIYVLLDYVRPLGVAIGIEELRMGVFFEWRDQEPAELLLSLGFLFFTIINYIKLLICLPKLNASK